MGDIIIEKLVVEGDMNFDAFYDMGKNTSYIGESEYEDDPDKVYPLEKLEKDVLKLNKTKLKLQIAVTVSNLFWPILYIIIKLIL